MVLVLQEFGFDVPNLSPDLFLKEDQIVRMGMPPIQLEIFTSIPGVRFEECYPFRWRIGKICPEVQGMAHYPQRATS